MEDLRNLQTKRTFYLLQLCIFYLHFINANTLHLFEQNAIPQLVKQTKSAVVLIKTFDDKHRELAQGTGFLIAPTGTIITNRHVIRDAYSAIIQTTSDDTFLVNTIIAEDKEGDLIKITLKSKEKAFPVLLLSTAMPNEGERVLVIGNPLGYEGTASDGIVSSIREIASFGKIIQITAPISPGSSGSPVLNMNGEVMGIATSYNASGQNINFAVPLERIYSMKPMPPIALKLWTQNELAKRINAVEEDFNSGVKSLWVDDYVKATEYFRKVLLVDRNNAKAFYYLGVCFSFTGQPAQAIEQYQEAIDRQPSFAEAYTNLGIELFKGGNYTEAIRNFESALQINNEIPDAHYNLGNLYHVLGKSDDAIYQILTAIRLKPDYALYYCTLGKAYSKVGRDGSAISAFKDAVRVDPDYAEAYTCLGYAYITIGSYSESIDASKKALHANPSYAEAHNCYGYVLGILQKPIEAIGEFKEAIRIDPNNSRSHFFLGLTYVDIDDKSKALNEYRILKDLDKEQADILFNKIYR